MYIGLYLGICLCSSSTKSYLFHTLPKWLVGTYLHYYVCKEFAKWYFYDIPWFTRVNLGELMKKKNECNTPSRGFHGLDCYTDLTRINRGLILYSAGASSANIQHVLRRLCLRTCYRKKLFNYFFLQLDVEVCFDLFRSKDQGTFLIARIDKITF